jgi:predicted Holliday junction resolvase-like endonuclease
MINQQTPYTNFVNNLKNISPTNKIIGGAIIFIIIVVIINVTFAKKYVEAQIVQTTSAQVQKAIDASTKGQIQTLQDQITNLNVTIANNEIKRKELDTKLADINRRKKAVKKPQTNSEIIGRLGGHGYEVISE